MRAQTWVDVGIELPPGRSGEVDTTCPQCSPTRKKRTTCCLSVNTIDGTWFCHHCGWAGGLGMNGMGYGARLHHRSAAPPPPRVYTKPPPLPENPLPPQVIQWFASRGIPEPVLTKAGIRWAQGAILFPYLRDGRLVNVKHRTLDKRFWMVAGCERILYGLDDIAGADEVCLVEGELDKLAIDAVQGQATVSVPDGAPAPDATHYASKFSFLNDATMARLRAVNRVLIGTDMDAPGQTLADELARRIGYEHCSHVSWHLCKDANELLVAQGPHAVLDALDAAKPFPVPADDDIPRGARPVRPLPITGGRRPVLELAAVEVSHAR